MSTFLIRSATSQSSTIKLSSRGWVNPVPDLILIILIIIYSAKSPLFIPKYQTYQFSAINSSMSLFFMKVVTCLPRLLWSSSSHPTPLCPLVNILWPTTILHSKKSSIPFQLPFLKFCRKLAVLLTFCSISWCLRFIVNCTL